MRVDRQLVLGLQAGTVLTQALEKWFDQLFFEVVQKGECNFLTCVYFRLLDYTRHQSTAELLAVDRRWPHLSIRMEGKEQKNGEEKKTAAKKAGTLNQNRRFLPSVLISYQPDLD